MGLIYVPLFLMMIFGARSQEEENVTGVQGKDVILPCLCGTRELKRWQTVKPEKVIYTTKQSEQNDLTRVEIYWTKNSSDCSLRLKNITVADSNTYKCIFKTEPYSYKLINLEVKPLTEVIPFTEVIPLTEVIPSTPSVRPDMPSSGRMFLLPENSSKKIFVIPIVAFLLTVGYLCNAYLKRRRNQQLQIQEVAEDFSEVV